MEKKDYFFSKVPIIRIMKIYVVLVAITLGKLFASEVNAQNISLELNNVRLKKILNEIERKSEFSFFYNNSIIDVYKKQSLNVENKNLSEVLEALFEDSNIDFSFVRDQIILFPKDSPEIKEKIESKNGLETYTYSLKTSLNDEKIKDKFSEDDKSINKLPFLNASNIFSILFSLLLILSGSNSGKISLKFNNSLLLSFINKGLIPAE